MNARLSVLLVEDHVVNQKVVTRMLERLSCGVEVAGDGLVAIERVRPEHALVLMDCSMPRCDGFEATRRIRALPADVARVPIVALTAHATPADRDRCLAAGMDHWLPKPVQPEDLILVLRRFTSWRPAPSPDPVDGILDRRVVDHLVQLGGVDEPEFFAGLVAEFGLTTGATLREAVAQLADLRFHDLRRTMHRSKSASSTMGATRLREACAKLEDAEDPELRENGAHWLAMAQQELGLAVAALGTITGVLP